MNFSAAAIVDRTSIFVLENHAVLSAAPTEILTYEMSGFPCGRLPDNHNGNLNTEKKRPICGDTAVDTEPSMTIFMSATPVNDY
ncbi:hypothetical protein Y032_0012g1859 [Ancylostoma ceylanicum]|uniref:Uncharacterized protein n=1 Tax=Ancylostoma ceylanicum TaxID=53326 RepID=A0A016VCK3_9BILA|nr:hypothetical protein Y032_0012g1859 [Ancylostoma ceylanicum]